MQLKELWIPGMYRSELKSALSFKLMRMGIRRLYSSDRNEIL
jgi:hypothetical protein